MLCSAPLILVLSYIQFGGAYLLIKTVKNRIVLRVNNANKESLPTMPFQDVLSNLQSSELNKAMESLSEPQRYELLLQSYGTSILDAAGGASKKSLNSSSLLSMQTLFQEMIVKRVKPSKRSTSYLLNAAAAFCSCASLAESIQLCISGGILKNFGVSIGGLTTPSIDKNSASFLEPVPADDREKEVLYATILSAIVSLWGIFEVFNTH